MGRTTPVDKAALRQVLRERRRAVDEASRRDWSSTLCGHVVAHPVWSSARTVAAYVGVRDEPDTTAILEAAWAAGKTLLLPRVVSTDPPRLQWVPCLDVGQLAPGTFGLLEAEPGPDRPARPTLDGVDLVLVPGLGFGSDGARIGFGKGHYDHALGPWRAASVPARMGLCFAAFLDPPEGPIPMEPLDVPMHYVASEGGVVPCVDRAGPAPR